MNRKTTINVISTILLQVTTIISGFIVPRLILEYFGSEVNGLISSLTQFLNYINLIEGGVSSVIMASLYIPLYEKNYKKINSIVVTANKFFKKIAYVFVVYTVCIAVVYPVLINTKFEWTYIFSLTLILGISLFIQYYFSLTWRLLLQADQKVYISSFVQILVIIINTLFTFAGIRLLHNIHLVKLVSAMAFILQPLIFNYVIDKKYSIDLQADSDESVLAQRWDGFGINIAAFLHGNTDVVVLTIFSTLKNVSIYSVYNLVATGIKSLITSISAGIVPSLGNCYAEDNKDNLNRVFNLYEIIIFFLTFTVYTCAARLIVPFVQIYTNGVSDANYKQPIFSMLLIASMAVFCLREPYVNMAYSAGKFKEVSKYAYVEAVINIICSVIFVRKWGLNGVALGTLFSMTYRTLCQVIFLKRNILYRSPFLFFKNILVLGTSSCIGYFVSKKLFSTEISLTWISWIIYALENAFIILMINSIFIFAFMRKRLRRN